jgi:hypothetical protein
MRRLGGLSVQRPIAGMTGRSHPRQAEGISR